MKWVLNPPVYGRNSFTEYFNIVRINIPGNLISRLVFLEFFRRSNNIKKLT